MSEQQTTVFESHAEKYEQAHNAHLRKYALMNPIPKEPKATSLITWHHWVVTLILIASAIVSASHTLPVALGVIHNSPNTPTETGPEQPEVIDYILAIATFVMIEVTAIYFAYSHIVNIGDSVGSKDVAQLLKRGMKFTVGAMLAINIYGVLSTSDLIQTTSTMWILIGIGS